MIGLAHAKFVTKTRKQQAKLGKTPKSGEREKKVM